MHRTTLKKLKAFTLIEMLLVIILIGIITSVSVLAMRNSAQQARIDKVGLEMQSVLQAAMAYETANGIWPPASDESNNSVAICPSVLANTLPNFALAGSAAATNQFPELATFIGNYFPNGLADSKAHAQSSIQSSLGASYCWAPDGVIGSAVPSPLLNPPYQPSLNMFDPTAARFWVALQVPGTGAAAYQFAQRLAAKLPNSLLLTNPSNPTSACSASGTVPCFVRSEVPKPGTGGGTVQQGLILAGVGYCNSNQGATAVVGVPSTVSCLYASGTYTIKFACSTGQTGVLVSAPNFLQATTIPANNPKTGGYFPGAYWTIQTGAASCTNAGVNWSCVPSITENYISTTSCKDATCTQAFASPNSNPVTALPQTGLSYQAVCMR